MYGLLISLSILVCIFIVKKLAARSGLNSEIIWDLSFWTIVGGILGARIYHVVTDWPYYAQHPINIVYIWNGGLGIFGAIAGGFLTAVIFFHVKNIAPMPWLNILGVILPLGQAIGRWGNYFNNEIIGKTILTSQLSFVCKQILYSEYNLCPLRHPIFLYEAILALLLFLILLNLYLKRSKALTFYLYIIGYTLIRFFIEFLKTGYTSINFVQILCAILFFLSLAKLFADRYSHKP